MANVTYKQLMQNYVNAPYSVLLGVAKDALNKLFPVFDKIASDGNGASVIFPFICTTLAVDGRFTELEYKFIMDVTGLDKSYDEFKALVQNFYNSEWVEKLDRLTDACPQDLKEHLIAFCLAFAAVDETITREENAFIAKLLA